MIFLNFQYTPTQMGYSYLLTFFFGGGGQNGNILAKFLRRFSISGLLLHNGKDVGNRKH